MKKENINKVYIPQPEGIPDINSYEGLNKHYLKVSESLSEIHKKEEEEAQNQHKQILELAGRKNITKEEGKTVVCDGAGLHCPFSGFTGEGHDGFIFQAPRNMKTITLKVKREKGKLMGKDSIATIGDCLGENFEPIPELMCQITGEKCKLNEVGGTWSNFSENLIVCGKNVILKESTLKCNIESILSFCPAETPLLSVEDNGQNMEIKHPFLGSLFSPSDRKFIVGTLVVVVTIIIFKEKVVAVLSNGGLIFLYNEGYLATGSAIGGLFNIESKTGIGGAIHNLVGLVGSYLETAKGGEIIIEKSKGIVGEPGVKLWNKFGNVTDLVSYTTLAGTAIDEAGMVLKNREIERKIANSDLKLKNLEKQAEGTYKIPQYEFPISDTKKEIQNLNNQKYNNFQFSKDLKKEIKSQIRDTTVEKIITSETSDWTTYRSQIEYSKQPFFTDMEIKGVK